MSVYEKYSAIMGRVLLIDWFCKTFEVDIDSLKEMTGRYINTDSTDHKQKSAYEMYAERMTVEKMDREFKRKCQNTQVGYKNNLKERLYLTSAHCIIYLERLIGIDFPIALSKDYYVIKEVAFTLGGGMLFLFIMIV